MIIDFTITNFRSIREKQTFSLCAESSSNHLNNNVAIVPNEPLGTLRSAGVYGANASGKSNLLLAFKALRYIICGSGDLKEGDSIPCYEPYRLSESCKNAPVVFEIEFLPPNNNRFLYSVSFDAKKILSETLDYYPSQSKANLFNRRKSDTWKDISFGAHYKGGRKRQAFFNNSSYLSKAGNSADAPPVIRTVFNYFRKKMTHLGADQQQEMLGWKEDKELVGGIASILSKVDTGISSIHFKEQDVADLVLPKDIPESIRRRIEEDKRLKPFFTHVGEYGFEQEFSEKVESAGTKKLFQMLPMIIDTFSRGGVLILDELDNSFHPHIAELIITLFNKPEVNIRNAQLIFSTHNINLMSPDLLRRDQVWLTEKVNGETRFYSLDEFDKGIVKIDSPFNKWYGEGRFGAIPTIDIGAVSKIIVDRMS